MPETFLGWLGVYGLLALSAFAAGVVNSLAGGGTLLTFPALAAIIPVLVPGATRADVLVLANTTSTIALMPGSAAAAFAFRRELGEVRRWTRLLIWPSVIGGAIGTFLLTLLPAAYFKAIVPWLILTAALLFMIQPLVTRYLRTHEQTTGPAPWVVAAVVGFQLLVAIYGGYFGAGIGILMLASLGLMGIGDIVHMNALKTFLAMSINAVSVVIFLGQGLVVWTPALVMAIASIAGGYLGGHAGRVLNKTFLRWFVIVVGLGLAVYYFVR